MKLRVAVITVVFALGLAGGLYFLRPHTFHGTVIQSPEPSFDFDLTGTNGNISLSDFRGKLIALYFGYTFCPDICPATLGNLSQALNNLGSKADDIQVIMISLDPERDTPERLAKYVSHFNPSFIGITGSKEQLDEVASLYGIFYEKAKGSASTDYLINHTATLLIVDREGYLKLVFPFGVTVDEITDDLSYLLKQ